jgi:thymidylate synthase
MQYNERTKTNVKATHGYAFSWNAKYHPVLHVRKSFPKTAAAELAWFLSGETSIAWLQQYTKIWNDFAIEGEISTAYGYRWRKAFGVDQIFNIITRLKIDPSSRQQLLLSWDPRVDNVIPAANIPCPFVYVFNIIDNKLNCHLTLRSNDVWLGLPYDLYTATLLVNALANSLDVEAGNIFYSIAHMHLYENQMSLAKDLCYNRPLTPLGIEVKSKFKIEDIINDKDAYIKDIEHDTRNYTSSDWNPKVQIVV